MFMKFCMRQLWAQKVGILNDICVTPECDHRAAITLCAIEENYSIVGDKKRGYRVRCCWFCKRYSLSQHIDIEGKEITSKQKFKTESKARKCSPESLSMHYFYLRFMIFVYAGCIENSSRCGRVSLEMSRVTGVPVVSGHVSRLHRLGFENAKCSTPQQSPL